MGETGNKKRGNTSITLSKADAWYEEYKAGQCSRESQRSRVGSQERIFQEMTLELNLNNGKRKAMRRSSMV